MPESEMEDQLTNVFILLKGDSANLFEDLAKDIHRLHGKIRHAFSPDIIFATLPAGKVDELLGSDLVGFITADVIDKPPPKLSRDKFKDIIAVWNRQIESRQEDVDKAHPPEDLSWDAPGYLPPDPPPDIRKMMDEWEKKIHENDSDK